MMTLAGLIKIYKNWMRKKNTQAIIFLMHYYSHLVFLYRYIEKKSNISM